MIFETVPKNDPRNKMLRLLVQIDRVFGRSDRRRKGTEKRAEGSKGEGTRLPGRRHDADETT